MTKVTSGGITIENGNVQVGAGATTTDMQGAFQKYTQELVMDGGLSQDDLDDIQKVTGQWGQIFSTLPNATTQAGATPSASAGTSTTPTASDNLKPRNDGTLFNSLNDGHMASTLQAKFTKSNDGKWTQEEVDKSEAFLKEQGITNPPTQEQKDKLKTTLGVTQPSATSSAAPSTTPAATTSTAPAPNATPSASATPAPSASKPRNDGTLFNSLNDGTMAKTLQDKFAKSKDGTWTQEEIDKSEAYLKEQGITNPPTQAQKDKLKTDLGITKPAASSTPSATAAATPAPAPKKETTAPKPPYSAKSDPVLNTFLEDGNTAIGSVYGGLAAEERQFFDEKLAKTKSQEEAFELINKLKQFASEKDSNRGYNGSIDGFHSQRDSNGAHLVDSGSEAERFMKEVLGVTPSYWG